MQIHADTVVGLTPVVGLTRYNDPFHTDCPACKKSEDRGERRRREEERGREDGKRQMGGGERRKGEERGGAGTDRRP